MAHQFLICFAELNANKYVGHYARMISDDQKREWLQAYHDFRTIYARSVEGETQQEWIRDMFRQRAIIVGEID